MVIQVIKCHVHWTGFSTVWVLIWHLRWLEWKILRHTNIIYLSRWHCYVSHNRCVYNIKRAVQSGFGKIASWFSVNTLILNVKKMTAMLFSSKWAPYRKFELDIHSGSDQTQSDDIFKYLGIHLDNFITFENHIGKITKEINQRTKSWYFLCHTLCDFVCLV